MYKDKIEKGHTKKIFHLGNEEIQSMKFQNTVSKLEFSALNCHVYKIKEQEF